MKKSQQISVRRINDKAYQICCDGGEWQTRTIYDKGFDQIREFWYVQKILYGIACECKIDE